MVVHISLMPQIEISFFKQVFTEHWLYAILCSESPSYNHNIT